MKIAINDTTLMHSMPVFPVGGGKFRIPTFFSFFFLNDPPTTEIYPLPLHDALPIFAIAAGHGGLHPCALLSDGSVKCWGALGPGNDVGQLGNGATAGSATPVTMTGTGGTAVTWTESSNGAVATIDATGLATGRGPGTTTITATAGSGASASTTLTVNPAPVAPTITTQPASQTVTAGP